VVDVGTVEEIEPTIRAAEPGRYHVDEIRAKPLPSGYPEQRWGIGIKRPDGSVAIDPDPWEK
jgi:hypothetical protein